MTENIQETLNTSQDWINAINSKKIINVYKHEELPKKIYYLGVGRPLKYLK